MKKLLITLLFMLMIILLFATNRAVYSINVSLNADTLKGYEKVLYINNSNDTISQIHFYLYSNYFSDTSSFYKDNNIKWDIKKQGYLKIDSCIINEKIVEYDIKKYNMHVKLPQLLYPNDSVMIIVYFEHKIPYPYLREGYKNGIYDIMQWYPQVNVYKDKKWIDIYPNNTAEFFTEYGDYELTLQLPSEYYVFGTGRVIAPDSELTRMRDIQDTVFYDYERSNNKGKKTIILKAENVNELAFILRREFAYIKDTSDVFDVEIVCKRNNMQAYREQIDNIKKAIKYFSNKYIEYPYNKITVADGLLRAGGGMEYPNFIMISDYNKTLLNKIPFIKIRLFEQVLVHEIAHQWFYQIIGSNQAKEPFLDESFAVYSEIDFMEKHFPDYVSIFNKPIMNSFNQYYIGYIAVQRNKQSTPIDYSSYMFEKDFQYGINVYSKGGLIVRMLEKLLGEETFDSIMKGYFQRYYFSHPSIKDFEDYINDNTDNKYALELKYILHENYYNDFYIKKIKKNNDKYIINIDNNAPFKISMPVYVKFKDKDTIIYSNDSIVLNERPYNIIIDKDMRYLDIDYYNNIWKKHWNFGIFNYKYFSNNVYILPYISHSIIERISSGILLYVCDMPSVNFNNMAVHGNYNIKAFVGYSPILGFLYKHSFDNYQGYYNTSNLSHQFAYNNYYITMNNAIKAFKVFEKDYYYKFSIGNYFRYHLKHNQYVRNRLYEGQLSLLFITFDYYKTINDNINYFINGKFQVSDAVLYSSLNYGRFVLNTGVGFNSNYIDLNLKYNFNILYGDENVENIFYINNIPNKLFYTRELTLKNYSISIEWDNYMNYYNPTENAFNTLQKFSFEMGKKFTNIYTEIFICSSHFSNFNILYQTGVRFNFGRFLYIDIPLYNDQNGNIIFKSFNISLSSHIIL